MFNFRRPTSSEKKIRIRVALVVKSLKLLRRCGDFDLALNESTVRRLISELENLNPEYSAEMAREGQGLARDLANELEYQLYGYNYKLVKDKTPTVRKSAIKSNFNGQINEDFGGSY